MLLSKLNNKMAKIYMGYREITLHNRRTFYLEDSSEK